MIRRLTDAVSVALILSGAYLIHVGLLMVVVGAAGLFVANRLERTDR